MSQTNSLHRSCTFVEAPNCSLCQICDGTATIFGKRCYSLANPEVDYSKGQVTFYEVDSLHSLNQAPETAGKPKVFYLPLNTAWEVFKCWEDIDKENERRISNLFT